MAKQRFSGALNAATFPLVSTLQGRTVLQPQADMVNVRVDTAFFGSSESAAYYIPRLLYCENVMPTAEGIQSVGYEQAIAGLPGVSDFDQIITIRDEDENNFLFCPANGTNYVYTANAGVWEPKTPLVGAQGKAVTRAYVNGVTYICYDGLGIYVYNTTTGVFDKQTLIGITDADVRGISSSNNYLIAYGELTVYWSSLVDPLDFVPSLTTGAGFAIPQDLKAKITAVISTSGGYNIYTAKNAVAASYTQNARAPFAFKEIANAGGILSYEQVTSDQNSGPQYAWTTGGLQKITAQGAESVSAEISDFLAGRMWESFDPTTKLLTQHLTGASEFQVKVTYISSRYLVLSYSVDNSGLYQYALVLDTALKRWGKLKIDHVDCMYYPYPNVFGDLTYADLSNTSYSEIGDTLYSELSVGLTSDPPSKKAVGFLKADGEIVLLEMDYNKIAHDGVAIFGKFQLVRARMMTMQTLDLEGTYVTDLGTPDLTVTAMASLDGQLLDTIQPMELLVNNVSNQRYAKRVTGINMSIAVEGTFALSAYVLEVTAEGDR